MSEIRVAMVGVGNSCSSVVQGKYFYKDVKESDELVPGLMHPIMGGYKASDITVVLAFDVDKRKVGQDLSEAIFAPPNNMVKFAEVPKLGVKVLMGPVMDGVTEHQKQLIKLSDAKPVEDVASLLEKEKVDVMVNNLPTGSAKAARFYAEEALKAGCGLINGMPELIVNDEDFARRAEQQGSPLVGDDYKSQVGGTSLHRALISLFLQRGIKITRGSQLNYGGHPDFFNLCDRGESKHLSKLRGVESIMPYKADFSVNVSYLANQGPTKICRIEMWGENFGRTPVYLEAKLSVLDSPNSAGVLSDAIRCCKIAKDRGTGGVLISASACFMKSAPKQFPDEEATRMLDEFIEGKRER